MESPDEPVVDDALTLNEADRLDARLQAAVDDAKARRWTDDLPERWPVKATGKPGYVAPERKRISEAEIERAEERLQRARDAAYLAWLRAEGQPGVVYAEVESWVPDDPETIGRRRE